MRFVYLLIFVFSLNAAGFSSLAHASMMVDHNCAPHQVEQVDGIDQSCHSKHILIQCDDCCCLHSDSTTTSKLAYIPQTASSEKVIIGLLNSPYSTDLSGLRRPPRF